MSTILTDDEIQKWWASENGFEDHRMCKLADFQQVARAVEAAVLSKLEQRNSRPVVEVIHARVEKMTPDQLAAYQSARERFKLEQQEPVAEVPQEFDVRRILLSVTPGDDGMGHEVCAANVADVEKKLGELWSELEEWQLGIRRLPAPQQADRQRVPDGWIGVVQAARDVLSDAEDHLAKPHSTAVRVALMQLDAMLTAAPEAPAQASAVDERDRKDAERYRWLSKQMLGVDFDWDESGKTALCFEMPDGCSFAADCDQVIDDARAALAQKGGR